ncbi:MAG: thioredoxin family protein, partial [Gaiellaceae bacterium]
MPIPRAKPIVYQSPIAGQCRDHAGFDGAFSGHTTTAPCDPVSGGEFVNDERPLLVFFWSERSGPARRMESLLAHLERKERDRLRVRRVDVDANPELAERFKVDVVPTLVLVKDRRAVSRLDGRTSAPKIEAMLEPHLPAL